MKNEREIYDQKDLMHHRRINLNDGRYLIFYTFDSSLNKGAEKSANQPENEGAEKKKDV